MRQIENFVTYLFNRQRWSIHFIYWLLVLIVYVVFFGYQNNNFLQTFIFVGLLMPVTMGATYFLNYRLVPQYLMKERYVLFILYLIYTVIAALFIEMFIAIFTFITLANANISNMSRASVNILFLMAALLMVVFLGVAIKLLLHWRKSHDDYQQVMLEKVETELKFLKMQLNPHFLFNTLNNLYYLASEKSDKTPKAILALSELLDYVLHNARLEYVSLSEELVQVNNFIALESLRYEDRLAVSMDVKGEPSGYKIGPMLLITLVENAFKHGVMQTIGKAWIKINIGCEGNRISLTIENSRPAVPLATERGIGLINLQNQLRLLYPERHSLEIQTEAESFSLHLELDEAPISDR